MKPAPFPPANEWSRRATGIAIALLVAACLLAYCRTFSAPFVYDDDEVITGNHSIRHLWPLRHVLFPAGLTGTTVSGRPMVNLTLALNYVVSGLQPWSYHAFNLLIHVGSGLLLAGIIRRTLLRPALGGRFAATATALAFSTAALWLLHPLQTESVTYVAQRAESLMGFFFLATLFAYIKSIESRTPVRWLAWSVVFCALGMATKEVMVAAPLLVLLYDRAFVAGSGRKALCARPRYYTALAATWLVLAALVFGTNGRGDSAGFAAGVSPWHYALTQCGALVHYLRLALWPQPLVFDYGDRVVQRLAEVWPQAVAVGALLGGTAIVLWRRPAWAAGFLGACFFAILAPSSSIVPVATQTMAEHRMYLPLAAVIVGLALILHRIMGRHAASLLAGVAALAAGATFARNEDYQSRRQLWADTAGQRPENPRAHNNLAIELVAAGEHDRAVAELREALRLRPAYTDARNNLANELLRRGALADAIEQYEQVLQAQPGFVLALDNLGFAYLQAGRMGDAQRCYERALLLDAGDASAHSNLGYIFRQRGDPAEALRHYAVAAQLQPSEVDAQRNLGDTLMALRQAPAAAKAYADAIRLRPTDAGLRFNRALALAQSGRFAEASDEVAAALRLQPDFPEARRLAAQLQYRVDRARE